jgi:hypothetical protein
MAEYDGHTLELRGNKIVMEPQEAFALVEAIMKWHETEQAKVWRSKPEETSLVTEQWITGYSRFGAKQDCEHATLDDALDFLIDGANAGELSFSMSGYIIAPSGQVINGDDLIDRINKREETR